LYHRGYWTKRVDLVAVGSVVAVVAVLEEVLVASPKYLVGTK